MRSGRAQVMSGLRRSTTSTLRSISFQETVAAIQGDGLVSSIPTIISNVQDIDESWTALQEQIDQRCPTS